MFIENDFSNYDSSQGEICHLFELDMLTFGVKIDNERIDFDPNVAELWKLAAIKCLEAQGQTTGFMSNFK